LTFAWFDVLVCFVNLLMISIHILGDGMGIGTTTAARIFDGQSRGESGEENVLSWETFPYTALSKTYNTDAQVPDSAGTATAYGTGVKTREGKYFPANSY
jgi:alkaline phosphatase